MTFCFVFLVFREANFSFDANVLEVPLREASLFDERLGPFELDSESLAEFDSESLAEFDSDSE